MKTKKIAAVSLALLMLIGLVRSPAEQMTREQILAEANDVARAMFESMNWNFWARTWVDGVFWIGVSDLSKVDDNPDLKKAIRMMGERSRPDMNPWSLTYVDREKEPHHADDMMIAQTFIDYYVEAEDKKPVLLEDTKRRLDQAAEVILSDEMADKAARVHELHWQEGLTWYWCDALFMAPAVFIRLSEITGDPKYLKAMHTEWKRTSDLLYDPEEHLYFRDKNFLTKKSKQGKKIFWSRGNGWVFAALSRVLTYLPKDDPNRAFYVTQFKEMAEKLALIQQPNGTWTPSLLAPEEFPHTEASGTAFYCYGLAWGINKGVLDEKTYRPVVEKAWSALVAAHRRHEKGFLGYVQGVGAEPDKVYAQGWAMYGNGAFLMAAVQMAALAPVSLSPAPELTAQAEYPAWQLKRMAEDAAREKAAKEEPAKESFEKANAD